MNPIQINATYTLCLKLKEIDTSSCHKIKKGNSYPFASVKDVCGARRSNLQAQYQGQGQYQATESHWPLS